MGVRGLTTFISKNESKFLEEHKLHNTFVIIDGNSLAFQLFCLHEVKKYFPFGGDYDKYAQHVRDFFQMFFKCNVKPVVVFDGGVEKKKLKTVIGRLQDKTNQLNPKQAPDADFVVFPLQLKQVFQQVMYEIGVTVVQCDFEADPEIAALGLKYKCPIISNDSDFYISGAEYIPITTIEHKVRSFNTTNQFFIHCKIFRFKNLLNCYSGLNASMMPLLSALSGNDYMEITVFRQFYLRVMHMVGYVPADVRIARVIEWLNSVRNYSSALYLILRTLEAKDQPLVLRKIEETMKSYRCDKITVESYLPSEMISICPTSSRESLEVNMKKMIDFNDKNAQEIDDENLQNKSQVKTNMKIPFWLLNNYRKGLVQSSVINILTLKTCFTAPQFEDISLFPSHEVSLPLLRAIIKIIHGNNKTTISYWARKRFCSFDMYNWEASNIDLPNLGNVIDQSPESRKRILLRLLKWPADFGIDIIPDDWKLYICTIFYWLKLKNAMSHKVTEVYVNSLVLCLIALSIIDSNLGFYRDIVQFLERYGNNLSSITFSPTEPNRNLKDLVLDVDLNDCIVCFEPLNKFHTLNEDLISNMRSLSHSDIHAFAQFQSCLRFAMLLNSLLIFPLNQCTLHKLFSGTFIYKVCSTLHSHKNIKEVIRNLLGKSPKLLKVFTTLVSLIFDVLKSSSDI